MGKIQSMDTYGHLQHILFGLCPYAGVLCESRHTDDKTTDAVLYPIRAKVGYTWSYIKCEGQNQAKMDTIEISLLVILCMGMVTAGVLEYVVPRREKPFQVAMLVGAIFLDIAAFVPQMIENVQVAGATDDIRPSFLILITISYFLKLPAERKLIIDSRKAQRNVDIVFVQAGAIFIPVIFYILWQFQCAYLSTETAVREHVLRYTGVFFSIVTVLLVYWVFRTEKSQRGKESNMHHSLL